MVWYIYVNFAYIQAATAAAVTATAIASKTITTAATKRGRGSRIISDRPPPGAVNLERSYEICRAVIQNSPNRHQLKAQLRPPPSMLAKNVQITSSATTQGTTVTKFVKVPDEQTAAKTSKVMFKVKHIELHPISIEIITLCFHLKKNRFLISY